jgi:isocitrate dehydrogenase (NAD+)
MMLTHMSESNAAQKLQKAIEEVYREHKYLTADVGGAASTEEFTDAVIKTIKAEP